MNLFQDSDDEVLVELEDVLHPHPLDSDDELDIGTPNGIAARLSGVLDSEFNSTPPLLSRLASGAPAVTLTLNPSCPLHSGEYAPFCSTGEFPLLGVSGGGGATSGGGGAPGIAASSAAAPVPNVGSNGLGVNDTLVPLTAGAAAADGRCSTSSVGSGSGRGDAQPQLHQQEQQQQTQEVQHQPQPLHLHQPSCLCHCYKADGISLVTGTQGAAAGAAAGADLGASGEWGAAGAPNFSARARLASLSNSSLRRRSANSLLYLLRLPTGAMVPMSSLLEKLLSRRNTSDAWTTWDTVVLLPNGGVSVGPGVQGSGRVSTQGEDMRDGVQSGGLSSEGGKSEGIGMGVGGGRGDCSGGVGLESTSSKGNMSAAIAAAAAATQISSSSARVSFPGKLEQQQDEGSSCNSSSGGTLQAAVGQQVGSSCGLDPAAVWAPAAAAVAGSIGSSATAPSAEDGFGSDLTAAAGVERATAAAATGAELADIESAPADGAIELPAGTILVSTVQSPAGGMGRIVVRRKFARNVHPSMTLTKRYGMGMGKDGVRGLYRTKGNNKQ